MAHCMDFRRNIYLCLQDSAKLRAGCCSTRSQVARVEWAGRAGEVRPLGSPSSRALSRARGQAGLDGGNDDDDWDHSVCMIDFAWRRMPSALYLPDPAIWRHGHMTQCLGQPSARCPHAFHVLTALANSVQSFVRLLFLAPIQHSGHQCDVRRRCIPHGPG